MLKDFKLEIQSKFITCLIMVGIAVLIGLIGGLSAILFRATMGFFRNLFFLQQLSFSYHETIHLPPSPIGAWIILAPVIGGLIVTWLINRFAFEQKRLGIPNIIYSIHYQQGEINPRSAIAKAFASAITIGTGGSVGREGPIVQMGAALSALLADFINIQPKQKIVFIAAAVAAVTAAMLNSPVAEIVFAIELILLSVDIFSVILMIISAITASFIKFLFFGFKPIFHLVGITSIKGLAILTCSGLCICLGVFIGLLSILFIRGIYWVEDFFGFMFKSSYLRHVLGMSLVGVMLYILMLYYGHYYIEGIGFATIQDTLDLMISAPWILLILFICKLLTTTLTLGSGASGGVFSPSLFLGATLGGAFGLLLNLYFPNIVSYPMVFVVVGMAAMLASVTGAFFTAIILVLELTNNLTLIHFITITSLTAFLIRKILCKESIYTLKLVRQGIHMSQKL